LKALLIIHFTLFIGTCFGQLIIAPREFDSTQCSQDEGAFSVFNKIDIQCPTQQKLSIALALNYFPDLKAKKIIFKETKIKTTLNARPTLASLLFSNRLNRKYVIRINSLKRDSIIFLDDVPFNARVGLFAHEFSHLYDYQTKSLIEIIGRGFSYLNKKTKAIFEKETDQKTIERGVGWQLYDWSYFVLHQSNASNTYKEFKAETYLKPSEIKLSIDQIR
jgi:hypothetical protein